MQLTPSLMARTEAEVSDQLTFLKSLYPISPVILSESEGSGTIDQNEILRRTQDDKEIILHLDVMDGQFIPSNTPLNYSEIVDHDITFDVHLMASHPSELLDKLPKTKIRYVYCHAELDRAIIDQFFNDCLKRNLTPALALNYQTPISKIPFLSPLPATSYQLPALLLMSVNPGDSGRPFNPTVKDKIDQIKTNYPDIFITVDGGINRQTIAQISKADCAVVHSSIFNAKDPKKELEYLQSL